MWCKLRCPDGGVGTYLSPVILAQEILSESLVSPLHGVLALM
jgi:hypothetical protein